MSKTKEKIKSYFRKRKQRISFFGVSIGFDWKVLLGVFIFFVTVSAGYGVYTYYGIAYGEKLVVELTEDQSQIIENQKRVIERTIELLDENKITAEGELPKEDQSLPEENTLPEEEEEEEEVQEPEPESEVESEPTLTN